MSFVFLAADAVQLLPNMMGNIATVLIVTVFVLFLAYFSIRMLAGARNTRRGSNMRIVEAIGVGFQSTLQLVSVGDKFFVIGVSKTGVTLIGEVSLESLSQDLASPPSFDGHMASFLMKHRKASQEGDKQKDKGDDV